MRLLKSCLAVVTIIILLACGLRFVLFSGPVVPPSPLPSKGIVDMHVHVAGIGEGGSGCYISDAIRDSYKFDYYLSAFGVTRDELKHAGDQLVFERLSETIQRSSRVSAAVVLAMDGAVDKQGQLDLGRTEVYIPNDYVAAESARYDNLHFGASINPYRPDALQRLAQVKRQGAKLIKWIPSIQFIDPADERIIPFYRKMKELELPLLTHTGKERSFTIAKDELADPVRLELPLGLGVTVIAAHIATTGETQGQVNEERLLRLFEVHPNLYADISSLTQINKLGYLNRLLPDPRLEGRLLYGSDFPLINMVLVSPFYFPLNLEVKEMVSLSRIDNLWDRDVALKQALGVPAAVFERSGYLLDISTH